MHRIALSLALVTGCGAYMSVGVDTGSKITGGLANPMKQTVTADPRIAAAATAAGLETTATEPTAGRTYTLEVGWRVAMFRIGANLQAHDADRSTFSLTDTSSPRYATATAAVDLAWEPVRWKMLSTFLHAGPAMGVLLERTSGGYDTGKGLRFGAGISASLSVATVFVDVYRMELAFDSGPAQGMSNISGATIGIGINR